MKGLGFTGNSEPSSFRSAGVLDRNPFFKTQINFTMPFEHMAIYADLCKFFLYKKNRICIIRHDVYRGSLKQ
jgi:hypothetical protein